MRLSEFTVGETYLVKSPNERIVRVEREGEWEFFVSPDADAGDMQGPQRHLRKCLFVTGTLPDVEITGSVSKKAAKQFGNVKQMLQGQTEDRDWDFRLWEEVWCERRIGRLEAVRGGKAMERADIGIRGEPQKAVTEVFCVAIRTPDGRMLSGRSPDVSRSPFRGSSIHGGAVEDAARVTKSKLKGDPFTLLTEEAVA